MARSLSEEMELVEAAIRRTLEAQSSTSPDGRQWVNPNLAELYRQWADLVLRIGSATGGRMRVLEAID